MVDIFALALSHGLLALAAIRLFSRPELDNEGAEAKPRARRVSRRIMKVRPGSAKEAAPDA